MFFYLLQSRESTRKTSTKSVACVASFCFCYQRRDVQLSSAQRVLLRTRSHRVSIRTYDSVLLIVLTKSKFSQLSVLFSFQFNVLEGAHYSFIDCELLFVVLSVCCFVKKKRRKILYQQGELNMAINQSVYKDNLSFIWSWCRSKFIQKYFLTNR